MNFTVIDTAEYKQVMEVWEASVRATHNFLNEADILYIKA